MDVGHQILLRRSRKLFVHAGSNEPRPEFVATLLKNIESIGFTFSPRVVERLLRLSPEELWELADELVPVLLEQVGAHVRYDPMYPNFPRQVMEMDEAELYLNAVLHYLGDAIGERILPAYRKEERGPLELPDDLKVIDLAEPGDMQALCRSLLSANTSLSISDQDDLRQLLAYLRDELTSVCPDRIPFKETAALACRSIWKWAPEPTELLRRYLRNATDVLRFATELSGGDTSLAGPTRYRSFTRRERRVLLGLLESLDRRTEDMLRHRMKWIRLGERLHPGDYSGRFPRSFEAFRALRNGERVETFASRVESCFRQGDFGTAAKLLKSRPGEMARRLDFLLRNSGEGGPDICNQFSEVASAVSTPVLLQLMTHFRHRAEDRTPRHVADVPESGKLAFFEEAIWSLVHPHSARLRKQEYVPMRTVFPKGQVSKLVRIPRAARLVAPESAREIVGIAERTLKERFARLPALGNAYVAPELKDYVVPFSQRSAAKALRTVARGSRLKVTEAGTLRFFLWWREGKVREHHTGRVDLDLSVTFFHDNWTYAGHISYTNLRDTRVGACHSGDITSAPEGASEFIDINTAKARSAGVRFAVLSVQSYTRHPYCNLPECFVGWMAREKPLSGEIYEPSTVQNKIDLAAERRIAIPLVVDLCEPAVIWADLALWAMPYLNVNIESNQRGLVHYAAGITETLRPNLWELFSLHAEARGRVVATSEEADSVFAVDQGVTPYDFDRIISEYLV